MELNSESYLAAGFSGGEVAEKAFLSLKDSLQRLNRLRKNDDYGLGKRKARGDPRLKPWATSPLYLLGFSQD